MSSHDFKSLSQTLSPEIYRQFKTSIETGKWPDGRVVSKEQRALLMEATILYEHVHLPSEQRSGSMPDQCQSAAVSSNEDDDTQPITLQ